MINVIEVVTHDGQFHQDEIFACVLLNYFVDSHLKITRTRNESIISNAKVNNEIYLIDVGFDYNFSLNNFDHHQSDFDARSSNGDLYSACGLIWDMLKRKDIELPSGYIIGKIDEFVNKVDRQDNGIEFFKEVEFISMHNYASTNGADHPQNIRFNMAYQAAIAYFNNLMNLWSNLEEIEKLSIYAISQSKNGIIFSEKKLHVNERMNASNNSLLVTKRQDSEYAISSLNSGIELDYSIKCPTPESWRGLSKSDLVKVSGFHGMEFSHKNGFFTVVRGTKEHALEIAKYIIDHNKGIA